MSDAKHTPGPWVLMKDSVGFVRGIEHHYNGENRGVIRWNGFAKPTTLQSQANAALIASAPELLESLEAAADQADAQFKCGDSHATFNRQTIDLFRAVITKAKGQQ